MTQEILALCRVMGAAGEEELLLPLVQAVEGQLAARLREGTTPEDCGPAFPLAAAMVVTDCLAGMTGAEEWSSFTAGELTIRREAGASGRGSKSLTQRAEELLAPWTGEAGFAFQGVPG